jgi:hypothetical protein
MFLSLMWFNIWLNLGEKQRNSIKNGNFVFLKNQQSTKWLDVVDNEEESFENQSKIPFLKDQEAENQVFKIFKCCE